MSQELQVLQCYACETYQTQIVKKSNKWICKICGEKQSLKKVFGQGSGKDCRVHCQRLNDLRRKQVEEQKNILRHIEDSPGFIQEQGKEDMTSPQRGASKWSKYLSQHSTSDEDDGGDLFDLRASQFLVPQCTPQSVGISQIDPEPFQTPSLKRLKSDNGTAVSKPSILLMDSDDDDCFSIDLPSSAESKAFASIVTSPLCNDKGIAKESKSPFIPKQSTVLKVSEREFIPKNSTSKPSMKLASDYTVFKDKPSIKNANHENAFPKQSSNLEVPITGFNLGIENFLEPEMDVPSETKEVKECGFVRKQPKVEAMETESVKVVTENSIAKPSVKDLKRAISLFEDIDNYSLEQLTKMCEF